MPALPTAPLAALYTALLAATGTRATRPLAPPNRSSRTGIERSREPVSGDAPHPARNPQRPQHSPRDEAGSNPQLPQHSPRNKAAPDPQLPQHSRSRRIRASTPIAVAIAGLFAITPATADPLLTWPDLTGRARPAADATVTYGPDQMQKVDVWLPAGRGPFPVAVMVHGGCWTTSIADRSLMNWIADDLRKSGVAVWNIDYRGVDRAGGGYPGTFLDAAAATDLLARNAARFHFDPGHVVAIGHSAGGHLALWLAARPRIAANSPLHSPHPQRIDHVVSLGGLPDLEATAASHDNGCGTEVVGRLVGSGRADSYADTSVPRLLPLGVPQELVNGREDHIIPYRLATGYIDRARKAGDRATLHTVPATGHVELIAPETLAWGEAKRLVLAALKAPAR